MRGGDGSGWWREAEDGATGRRRISARGEAGRLGAAHQRASQAQHRRPGGASAPAGDAVARRGTSARTGGAATVASGAAAAAIRRGGSGRLARGAVGVEAHPNPSPSRPLGHWPARTAR